MASPDSPRRTRLEAAIATLAAATSLDAVIEILRSRGRAVSGSDGVALIRRDGPIVVYLGEDAVGPLWTGQRFILKTCISGLAIADNCPILIADILADPRVPLAAYAGTFVRSMAMIPIGFPVPRHAIGAYWRTPGEIEPEALALLTELATTASEALARIEGGEPMAMPGPGQAG